MFSRSFSRIYGALCLVLLVNKDLVAAQQDVAAIEKLIESKLKRFEDSMMETLQAYLQHHNKHVEQEYACEQEFNMLGNMSKANHQEVISKSVAQEAKIQDVAELIKQFEKRGETAMKKLEEQLTSVMSELNQVQLNVFPTSCASAMSQTTGIYYIRPYAFADKPFPVLCGFDDKFNFGGGWTVFQRRFNGSQDFYQNWTMYKHGFGDVNGEHWLGLEKIHALIKFGRHQLLVLLEDFDGKSTYALYDDFKVGSEEEKYKLTMGTYSGTAGDSLNRHNGFKFTTHDQNNNPIERHYNCADSYKGAWWFSACHRSHLNGPYRQKGEHLADGVDWISLGTKKSLKSSTMMLRRRM